MSIISHPSVKLQQVSKTETAVIFQVGFNCRECQKAISHEEWKEKAKMCSRCYDADGE